MSKCKPIQIGQPDQFIQVESFITVFPNQFGKISILYFTESDICHNSSFCLRNTVTECILNIIYWTPELQKTYHFLLGVSSVYILIPSPKLPLARIHNTMHYFYYHLLVFLNKYNV